jgi:hypothetical protein
MYSFILFYVTSERICVQTPATGCLPYCSLQIYQYQCANIVVTSIDDVTICTDSKVTTGSLSAALLQEFFSLMQTILSEICWQTAALEDKY